MDIRIRAAFKALGLFVVGLIGGLTITLLIGLIPPEVIPAFFIGIFMLLCLGLLYNAVLGQMRIQEKLDRINKK